MDIIKKKATKKITKQTENNSKKKYMKIKKNNWLLTNQLSGLRKLKFLVIICATFYLKIIQDNWLLSDFS